MNPCDIVNAGGAVSYVDSYGELHILERVSELINKAKSEGYKIGDSKTDGHFSGVVIASDL